MAISVTDTVVRWTGTPATNADITSASFTPPDSSLLVLTVNNDQSSGDNSATTFAVATTGLTWTNRIQREHLTSGSGLEGAAAIFTAPVTTGAAMTAAVRRTTENGGTNRMSCKLYIVTGQHASPIGTTNSGNYTADPTNASLTAAGAGRLFGAATDWNQTGSATSTDTEDAADYSGAVSVVSAYKAADHASGSQTINFNPPATPSGNWVLLEILAAADAGGATTTKTMTETFSTSDAALDAVGRVRLQADALTLTDAFFDSVLRLRQSSDTIVVDDSFIDYVRYTRRTDDSLTIIDSIVQQLSGSGLVVTKVMSETLVMTDGTIKILNWVRAQTDTITLDQGQTIRSIIITANEELAITDGTVEVMRFKRIAQDAIDLIDAFSKSVGSAGGVLYAKVMSDSTTIIDNAGQRWTLRTSSLSDTLALSDAALRALSRIRIQGDVIDMVDGNVSIRRTVRFASDAVDVPDELIRTIVYDQLYSTNFRIGIGADPFRFGMGAVPFN